MQRVLVLFFCVWSFSISFAQVDVTATGGTLAASYSTLKGAFDAINAGTHTGTITISISADATETAPAVLNASGSGSASYTTITISPIGGAARTISGAIAAGSPLLDFNGADNVTIDGLNTGGNSLTISNTTASGTSGTSTIRFIGGATNNVITNCTVLGSFSAAVGTNGGNIFFSTDGVTASGNDNNTISNCNIGPAGANLPTKGIYGNGSTTTTAVGNSGILIDNNNIYDFFGAAVTSAGIYTAGGCNTWSITNNRFYQTAARTWTTGAQHIPIWVTNATSTSGAQGFTITGNIIGYASNTQTGTYTLTGSSGKFIGILFNGISTGITSTISSNTVAAVSMTGVTSSGTSTSSPFTGILFQEGNGVTNSNTIGSQSVTGSLTFSTTTTSATDVYGIYNFSSNAWTSNTNNIGGISVTNLGASGTFLVYGMRAFTGSSVLWSANSNNIGGTVANSIQLTATGISSQVVGMFTSNAPALLTSNTIRNLTTNIGTGTTTGASVIGINITTSTPNHTVAQNTIYNLSNTNTTAASVVTGIQFTGSTANVVERNFIYGLTSATNNASAEVNGIRIGGGTTIYRNNMIALGAGISNAIGGAATNSSVAGIVGINEALGTNSIFHNSVYIGGTATSGSGSSYAFNGVQTTNTRSFRDNIFFNARTNSGATGKHYAIKLNGTAPNPTGLTINNNVYFANGSGAVFGFYNSLDVANLGAWKTAVGQDASSFEMNPEFADPTNALPNLHLHPTNATVAEGNGFDVGVVNDFDGETRSGLTPVDIGADAGNYNGIDLAGPSISYTALLNTSLTSNRTLASVTITDASGVPTSGSLQPRIWFRQSAPSATSWGSTQGTLQSGTGTSGVWDFEIDYSVIGVSPAIGDVFQYYVVAQDVAGTPNISTNPAGGVHTDVNTQTSAPAVPNSYTIIPPPLSGDYTVGVTLFSRVTGLNISFEQRTRMVEKDVPIEQTVNSSNPKTNAISPVVDLNVITQKMLVEETYSVPMVNGVEYKGSLYHEFTQEERDALGISKPLAGIYARVRDAVDDYNLRGVSGHTRFLLTDPLYDAGSGETFPFIVATSSSAEPSASATVTFQPDNGVVSTISGSSSTGIFVLGDNYVKIDGDNDGGSVNRDLTIQNTGTGASSYVIGFFNFGGTKVAKNCTVRYTNVRGGVTAVATVSWGIILNGSGGDYDNALLEYNKIWQALVGIGHYGVAATGINNDCIIRNNIIGDATSSNESIKQRGIEITQSDNLLVLQNEIFGNPSGNSNASQAGIGLFAGATNTKIRKNNIHDFYYTGTGGLGCFGILYNCGAAANTGTTEIYNNFISNIKGDGDQETTSAANMGWLPQGICILTNGTAGIRIYHNSIHMLGATLGSSFNGSSTCLGIAGTVGVGCLDIQNNIFRNSMTPAGGPNPSNNETMCIWVPSAAGNNIFSVIDYNDYHADGNLPNVGHFSTFRANLLAWQGASGQDVNSKEVPVNFVGAPDLHLAGASIGDVNLLGANLTSVVADDIDGDSRLAPPMGPYMGADEGSMPLPVELSAFIANVRVNAVMLSWTTKTEINSAMFEVQRRKDSHEWINVGMVQAAGNSSSPKEYSFTDSKLQSGKYSYRLRMVDADGKYTYSNVIEAEVGLPSEYAISQNYPNPFNPTTRIDYQLPFDSRVTIELYGITGEKVATIVNTDLSAGYYTAEVNAGQLNLASGVYIYRIAAAGVNNQNFSQIKKLVLTK